MHDLDFGSGGGWQNRIARGVPKLVKWHLSKLSPPSRNLICSLAFADHNDSLRAYRALPKFQGFNTVILTSS